MRHLGKIKRVPYIIWYTRHHLVHLTIGLVYAWVLRELWGEFSLTYIVIALIGSEIIDADHMLYFFLYGRHDHYSREVKRFLREGRISSCIKFMSDNHKYNTSLATHNVYVLGFFAVFALISFALDWKVRLAFFGAIALHLLYDIYDDWWALGYINENWRHLRRNKAAPPVVSEID